MQAREHDSVDAVVRAVREHAGDFDFHIDGTDARLTVDGATLSRPWRYVPRRGGRGRPRTRSATPDGIMILTDRLTKADAAEARRRGIWYADATGRMYVRGPGVLVDIREPRPVEPSTTGNREAPRPQNLMTPARAQVVCCLLAWPEMAQAPVRVLADVAGVSVGLAQQVLAALASSNFLTVGNERLINVGELLEQWAGAFTLGLARKLELARFSGEPDPSAWVGAGHPVHVSGAAAIPDRLHTDELTLYVPHLDPRAVIGSGWRGPEPGRPANVIVRRQFWTEPDGPLDQTPSTGGVRSAPLPLVYADLVAAGEPRHREAARDLRGEVLGLHAR